MELVAFLGKDKENWGQVTALLNRAEYNKAVLIKSKESEEFPANSKCITVKVDTSRPVAQLADEIKEKLKKELSGDFEVSLSLASGSGKEHMAVISALLNIPVGVKLIVYTKEGIKFLT
jgi:hypothetical protein